MSDLNFKSFSKDLGPGRGLIGDILTLSLGQPNTLYVIHVLGTRVYFILYAFSHSSFGYVYTYIRVLISKLCCTYCKRKQTLRKDNYLGEDCTIRGVGILKTRHFSLRHFVLTH